MASSGHYIENGYNIITRFTSIPVLLLFLSHVAKKATIPVCRGRWGHGRTVRHVRTPPYRPRGIISGFEIVLHCVILPPFPPCDLASR